MRREARKRSQIAFIMLYTAHQSGVAYDILLCRTRGVCVDALVYLHKQWHLRELLQVDGAQARAQITVEARVISRGQKMDPRFHVLACREVLLR